MNDPLTTKEPYLEIKKEGYVFQAYIDEDRKEWLLVVHRKDGQEMGEWPILFTKPVVFGIPDPTDVTHLEEYCQMLLKHVFEKVT